MTTTALATASPRVSLVSKIAQRYSVEPGKLLDTLKATAFKGNVTNEQMMALLIVADQHGLNPFTKEIYAFPDKQNGIVPVVGVDGWARIINEHPQFDGMEFTGDGSECTCTIWRKDRRHPIVVTEYLQECRRDTGPWRSHPMRMLRHKAMIQCSRLAFGFAGIYDPDEAERVRDMGSADEVLPAKAAPIARVQAAIRRPAVDSDTGEIAAPTTQREALDTVARIDAELAQPVDPFIAEMNAAEEGAK